MFLLFRNPVLNWLGVFASSVFSFFLPMTFPFLALIRQARAEKRSWDQLVESCIISGPLKSAKSAEP